MKYFSIFFITITLTFGVRNTNAQNGEGIAHTGPFGVYIISGTAIGNDAHPSHGIIGYRIERKQSGESDFKVIAELSTPETKGDLERAFVSALNDVPYPTPLANVSIDKIWARLDRFHEIDSLPLRGSILALRIALGVMYLDRDVKVGNSYEYKVITLKEKDAIEEGKPQKITFAQYAAPGEVYHRLPGYVDSSSTHLFWHKSDNTQPTSIACYKKAGFGSFTKIGIRPAFIRKRDSLFYSVVDTTLQSDVHYSYYLQPIDYFGNPGPASDTISIHTVNAKQLKLPDHIRAEINADRLSVKLSWTFADTTHAIGIRIYRGEENGKTFMKIGECSSTKKNYIDESIVPDITYLYYLTTLTTSGEESGSTAKIFAVSESNHKPLAPFALSASAEKDGVHLKWYSAEPYLKGFYVYRGEGFHASLKRISGIVRFTDSVTTYLDTDKSLSPKNIYSYSVLALSTSNIEGALSDSARVQPNGVTVPPRPFNVDAIASGNSIKLFWDEMRNAEPSVVGYNVYRREQGKDDFEKLGSKDLSAVNNNYTDSAIKAGITYEYYIRTADAYNGLSENTIGVSAMVAETTVPQLPVPIGLRGEATEDGISITWGGVLGGEISGYKLYRREGDSDPKEIATITPDKTNYRDTAVKKDTEYTYTLTTTSAKKTESQMSKELRVKN